MGVFRIGFASVAAAAAANYATFNSPTNKSNLREISLMNLSATESRIALGTPANEATPPVIASAAITPLGKPGDAAATARIGNTTWSTVPTVPAAFEHYAILANVAGAGVLWKWAPDEYLQVKIGGWRTFWNPSGAAGSSLAISILYDE